MNRVFICGQFNFPHNSAGANYVQYLALAFNAAGKEVHIVTDVSNTEDPALLYLLKKGIVIDKYSISSKRIIRKIDMDYFLHHKIAKKLNTLDTGDLVVAYSRDEKILKKILQCCKRANAKSAVCVVEWYDRENVSNDSEFKKFMNVFENINGRFDCVIPISSVIEAYYTHKGVRTVYLPIMIDVNEFGKKVRNRSEIKRFIYPANGKIKDSLLEMIKALEILDDEMFTKCEIHFCGIKKAVFEELASEKLNKVIGKNIIFHKWLTYEQLVNLYQEMDFLLLARGRSRMTESNFPSKVPETMTYGVIPIVSDVGDYTQLYLKDGRDSIFIYGNSAASIVKSMRQAMLLSENEMDEMRKNAQTTAINTFDYNNWVNIVKKI